MPVGPELEHEIGRYADAPWVLAVNPCCIGLLLPIIEDVVCTVINVIKITLDQEISQTLFIELSRVPEGPYANIIIAAWIGAIASAQTGK